MGKESSNRALYKTIQGIRNNRRSNTGPVLLLCGLGIKW